MNTPLRALIVEDSETDTELLVRMLRQGGFDPVYERVETPEDFQAQLTRQSWDIIFSDHAMPRFNSLDALKLRNKSGLDIPFIILSGTIGEETAVEAMKAGANDYFIKGKTARLIPAVQRECQESKIRSARHRAEEELSRSEARFKNIVESNLIGILLSDLTSGKILEANDAFLDMVGYTREELVSGKISWREMTPPDEQYLSDEAVQELQESGVATPFEKRYIRKDGNSVDVYIGGSLLAGRKNESAIFVLDISKRVQAERELQKTLERERLVKRIVERANLTLNINDLLNYTAQQVGPYFRADCCVVGRYEAGEEGLRIKVSGEYYRTNDVPCVQREKIPQALIYKLAQATSGRYPKEVLQFSNVDALISRVVTNLQLSESEASLLSQEIRSAADTYKIASGMRVAIEYRGVLYGGMTLYRATSGMDLPREDVELFASIATHLGESLYQNELYQRERSARSEAEMAQHEAEIANKRKSQFLANMSHELRTPLNAIIGFSQMLESGFAGELNKKQVKYAQNIQMSGRHLLKMVNELLDVSKIEAGQLTLSCEWVPFDSLIERLTTMVADSAAQKEIKVTFQVEPGMTGLNSDPARLQQIFLNLLSNAIKFNRPGGEVWVRIHKTPDGNCAVFDVEDTGIGIPAELLNNLFTPFYQVDDTYSRKEQGTGLGLSVVKQLVELHDGSVSVKSTPGKGSTFTISLPIRND